MNLHAEISTADLREAGTYLPLGTEAERDAFVRRQLSARQRVHRLMQFYGRNPCRMARIHLLTASSVAIGRLCGFSPHFHVLGEAIMPVDAEGRPRSKLWEHYQKACEVKRPQAVRDELWLEAHVEDWKVVREMGLDREFFEEAKAHPHDPVWELLQRHAKITFGTRVFEHLSEAGLLPHETTISFSMALSLQQGLRYGWPVVCRYLAEALRSLVRSPRERRSGVPSYRRIGATVLWSALASLGTWKIYRRGLRIRNRGVHCPEVDWPLLETLLGKGVEQVHPLIVKFYRNPGRFTALASLDIRTLPLMTYSWLAAILVGQGLYEGGTDLIPARLRVYQREDGSMHFVRELYCGNSLRVFDSDFVLREVAGKLALVEVFGDIGIEVVLDAEMRVDGGVAIVGRDIYWRGIRLPRTALRIDFASRVCRETDVDEFIEVVGRLSMAPRTSIGRFVMHTLLRRPKELGQIRYIVRPIALDSSDGGTLPIALPEMPANTADL